MGFERCITTVSVPDFTGTATAKLMPKGFGQAPLALRAALLFWSGR
jgi:hypothetical protein